MTVTHHALAPTTAELRVLALCADGLSYQEVADALVCSRETVKSHLRNVRVKLDAASTTQAVATAIRQGMI